MTFPARRPLGRPAPHRSGPTRPPGAAGEGVGGGRHERHPAATAGARPPHLGQTRTGGPRASTPVAPLLQATGIHVRFGDVRALSGVDLRLYQGEVHALLGENGAGKSTLVGVLAGVHRAELGRVVIDGEPLRAGGRNGSDSHAIATVFQDQHLCPSLSVGENVMLGDEVRGWFGIDWRATRARAAEALAELGIGDLDPRARLDTLAPAARQLVAIARATQRRPRVLILDEPTSSLDQAEVETLFAVIRRLRDSGVAIVFISHFLEQVMQISDRMTILRDGVLVGEYLTGTMDRADIIAKMLGRELDALKGIRSHRLQHRQEPVGAPVYEARAVGRRSVFAATDLDMHAGEVVGFAGLRGSGRTELARLLCGIDRRDSGGVTVAGRSIPAANDATTIGRGIALVSEDRWGEGIIGALSARENLLIGVQAVRGWHRPLSAAERTAIVDDMCAAMRIDPADLDRPIQELSGGTQQRVVLARYLATAPRVLILDEPTRGLDIEATLELHYQVAALAVAGTAVVFISSELEEVIRLSDRVVIVKDRETIGEVSNGPGLTVDSIVEIIASRD